MKQGTLEKIQNLAVSLQLVTFDDMQKNSLPQLVTMIANKLNELMNEVHRFETDVIEMVETQNENIQYFLGEGLYLEVATVFENWMEDGTFNTLINQTALKKVNDRIDETNAHLSSVKVEKMDKATTEISIGQINPNKGKITESYLSDELLASISGTAAIHAIPKRSSILLEHNAWLNVIKLNLYNKNTSTPNTIMNSNGYTSTDETYECSDYIPVEPGMTLFNSSSLSGAYFDSNKNYVSGLNAGFSNPFIVPEGVKFLRLTYAKHKVNVLCEGNKLINADAKYGDLQISWNSDDFHNLLLSTCKEVEVDNTAWAYIKSSPNIYNDSTAIIGKYVVPTNGYTASDSHWKVSDFIEIDSDCTYEKSNTSGYAFYTGKDAINYISGGTGTSFTTPSNARYVRVSVKATSTDFMLCKESLPSDYWNYGENRFELKDEYKESVLNVMGAKKLPTDGLSFLIFGDSITETATVSDDGSEYTEGTNTNWVTYSKTALKMGQLWNYAKAGAAYKDRSDVLPRQKISHQITTAIANNRPADIIVISAGTNDWQSNLGDFDTAMSKTTLDDLDRTNLYEALRWSFWTLRKEYPNAICFVATPIQRADADPFNKTIKAIIEMAERYNFVVIPAHSECGIIKEFEVVDGQGKYLYDGLHPDTKGKKLMSKFYNTKIINYLENYFI